MKHQTAAWLVALIGSFAGTAAAQEAVHRSHSFDAEGVEHLRIEYRVGTISLEPADGNQIEVELRIEPKDGPGWFSRRPDLEDMDLAASTRTGRLTLSFQERNVSTHWVVRLPTLARLTIDAGVGAVQGRLPATDVEVHLGVGDVDLEMARSEAGRIELKAGVGDTSIDGAGSGSRTRAFVSSESSAEGSGPHPVRAAVGVGEVRVALR